ncbi:MAG: hypothetical protein RLZZ142_2753 [Verrucomicrobiota bacterium]
MKPGFHATGSLLALALAIAPPLDAKATPVVLGFERLESHGDEPLRGALLFNELGCANCHEANLPIPPRRGPTLDSVTRRVQHDWLRAFLRSPETLRPGSNMPSVLPKASDETVDALIQFLASLSAHPNPKPSPQTAPKTAPKNSPSPQSPTHVNSERGKEIYHSIGCVACHSPGANSVPPEGAFRPGDFSYPSVPWPELSLKYSLSSLTQFLRDPLATRPDGRMPKLPLEPQDAVDLAGYLLAFEGSDGREAPKIPEVPLDAAAVAAGKAIFIQAQCANCHEADQPRERPKVRITHSDAGCLAPTPADGLPRYSLHSKQRDALLSFLNAGPSFPKSSQQAQTASLLHLAALNCLACHERDGLGGPDAARKGFFQGDPNLGDTGRFPPPLTGIGRKLQPQWLSEVLAGGNRVRPYLKTQMPVYGRATDALPPLLEKGDAQSAPPLLGGDDSAGRKLLGTTGGMGCITCHRWGERASLGIQALDLSNLGQRLRPEWLLAYLVEPAAYRPDTLMPSFWPKGVSSNREVLEGDTRRQVASIYSFAKSANGEPEGFPQTDHGEYELLPKDAPIVQRTFLKEAGTHAVLVGFPQGIHLAYDGKAGRPALAWKERFFDAYTTWFSRFAPFEKPAGTSIVRWPPSQSHAVECLGFKFDAQRIPIFLLKVDGMPVEERFEPVDGALTRTLTGDPSALEKLPVIHPEHVQMEAVPSGDPRRLLFRYLWK